MRHRLRQIQAVLMIATPSWTALNGYPTIRWARFRCNEVLDAQRELFTVQQSVVATRRTLPSAAAQLYKALGGGIEEKN